MEQRLKARLTKAIERAVSDHHGPFTASLIAQDIIADSNLWETVRDALATDKLVSIINGTLRGPLHQANTAQLDLPGFEDLPKVFRAGRKWVNMGDATAAELAEFAKWYRSRLDRNVERTKRDRQILHDVELLHRVVARYDKDTPGITVSEVLKVRKVRAELREMRG